MKIILKYLFFILLMGSLTQLSMAQDKKNLDVKAIASGASINIKWAMNDVSVWEAAKTNGFVLTRWTQKNGSTVLSPASVNASRLVLDTLQPFNRSQLLQQFGSNNELAKAADSIYYDTKFNKVIANGSFYKAVEYNNKRASKNLFILLLAERDFDIAKALGLAFTDNNVVIGNEYLYTVMSLPLDSTSAAGSVVISASAAASLLPPTGLTVENGNKKTKIGWDISSIKDQYSFYNIYRSDNGGTSFQKINSAPYLFVSNDQQDETNAVFYKDSFPANNVVYQYYIKGLTAFGTEGPASSTISATGKPDAMPLNIDFTTVTTNGNNVIAKWGIAISLADVTVNYQPSIAHFNIYKQKSINDQFELVAGNISSTARADTFALSQDYYLMLEMIDIYSNKYWSPLYLAQFVDSIAPAKPLGLIGKFINESKVRLSWTKNTEADLKGYKVLFSYQQAGPYTPLTVDCIVSNEYYADIIANNANDKIYYKILALDNKYNASVMSDAAVMDLPDHIGPSSPILVHVLPRPEGLRIAWALSPDKNISKHKLQRRTKAATVWTDIIGITSLTEYPPLPLIADETTPSNFIDVTPLEKREYEYRLIVGDNAGNYSISKIITVKPYDDGLRGTINGFSASLLPKGTTYYTINDNVDLANTPQSNKSDGKVAKLQWQYSTTYPSSLLEFKIYQKTLTNNGTPADGSAASQPVLVKTIKADKALANATFNGLNGYAVFLTGIKIDFYYNPKQYTILAYHKDGGFSPKEITVMPTQ